MIWLKTIYIIKTTCNISYKNFSSNKYNFNRNTCNANLLNELWTLGACLFEAPKVQDGIPFIPKKLLTHRLGPDLDFLPSMEMMPLGPNEFLLLQCLRKIGLPTYCQSGFQISSYIHGLYLMISNLLHSICPNAPWEPRYVQLAT